MAYEVNLAMVNCKHNCVCVFHRSARKLCTRIGQNRVPSERNMLCHGDISWIGSAYKNSFLNIFYPYANDKSPKNVPASTKSDLTIINNRIM